VEESQINAQEGFQRGLVAYFDILGFGQVVANEYLEKTARLVESALLDVPALVEKQMQRTDYTANLHWKIFADSILLWPSFSDMERKDAYHMHQFFHVCAALMQLMFKAGLPLRGAISEGDFFIRKHCFVGKPISDCHDLAEKTAWTGCVITTPVGEKLQKMWRMPGHNWKTIMEQVCLKYPVPLKNAKKRARYLVIKWFHLNRWTMTDETDPRISVEVNRSFRSHGKKIGRKEIEKVENTKAFLEFVDSVYVNSNKKIPSSKRKHLLTKRKFEN
jgi:hypothetical protein